VSARIASPTSTVWAVRTDGHTVLTAARQYCEGSDRTSAEDKVTNKIDDLGGKAEEAAGKVTGDDSTRTKQRSIRRTKSSLKDAGEKVKRRVQELTPPRHNTSHRRDRWPRDDMCCEATGARKAQMPAADLSRRRATAQPALAKPTTASGIVHRRRLPRAELQDETNSLLGASWLAIGIC
jgi:uncharacterized protein YjbJ (UPF0337 family)